MAIAAFVEMNAPSFQGWLDSVAEGVRDDDGKWLVRPDPQRAFDMVQSLIEYHVPKLNRTEVTGEGGGPVEALLNINVNFRKPSSPGSDT